MTWRSWAAGLVAGMLGVATAVGVAAGDDDIHACINKKSGTVREAGPNRDCAKNEIAIAMSGSAKGKGGTLTINGIPFSRSGKRPRVITINGTAFRTGTLPKSLTINGTAFRTGTLPNSLTINGNAFRTGTLPNSLTINGNTFRAGTLPNSLTINGNSFKSSKGGTLTINGTEFAPGAAAAKGDTGAQGPQGVQGPSGTSHVYSATGAPTPSGGVGEITLSLPAGKYAVTATADASNTDTARELACSLQVGGSPVDTAKTTMLGGSGGGPPSFASLSLQAAPTLAAAGSVVLHCDGGAAAGLTFDGLAIQAIAVDAVN